MTAITIVVSLVIIGLMLNWASTSFGMAIDRVEQRRRKTKEGLRESEKNFRNLVESSLIGISIIQDNRIVYQNQEHILSKQEKMASLGRVTTGIAHEIRNPLSGINIYLSSLKNLHHKDGSEGKVEQILKQMHSASNKVESILRRVMDYAKPGELKLALIDINEPITDAIKLASVTMRKSGIKIETILKSDLPQACADKNLIETVVLNLINNAAEAMRTIVTSKKIVVVSFIQDDSIHIQVSDSGPGVPEEIRDKILDPYFTTKQEGTGIGLSLCHRIIMDHSGSIDVCQGKWGGAEFRIEIPISRHIP
jgi:signal transduction histidine kinase